MSIQSTYAKEPTAAFAGQLVKNESSRPMFNAEASASIPFGVAVAFKATSAGQEAVFPTGTLEIAGIVVHNHSHMKAITLEDATVLGDLDATGLKVGAALDVLEEGECWAICVDGCNAGDRLWVVKSDGTLRASDSGGGLSVDATTRGRWVTKASAGALARLSVDFTGK